MEDVTVRQQRPRRVQALRSMAITRAILASEEGDETARLQGNADAAAVSGAVDSDDLDARGTLRGSKRQRPDTVHTCTVCMEVFKTDEHEKVTFISTCAKSSEHVICLDCLPLALTAVTGADGVTLTMRGLCLSHMSHVCSKGTTASLFKAVSPYVDVALIYALKRKVFATQHASHTLDAPLSLMAACDGCGATASIDPPDVSYYGACAPFAWCKKCKSVTDAICLMCNQTAAGLVNVNKRTQCVAPGFAFASMETTYTFVDGKCVLSDIARHNKCASFSSFESVCAFVRETRWMDSASTAAGLHTGAMPTAQRTPVVFPSDSVQRFFNWAVSSVVYPVGMEPRADMDLVDEATLLHVLRSSFSSVSSWKTECERKSRHALDVLYDRAMKQRCFKCGKAGMKDTHCTHIGCCGLTWCYVCEQRVTAAHACPLALERGDMFSFEEGTLLSPIDAVSWFHTAKLASYARAWLCNVGIARGLYTLLMHSAWRTFVMEHASKMFVKDSEKVWFITVRLNEDVRRECCF